MDNPYSANQYPDLSLAMTPNVASGQDQAYMPVDLPPIPRDMPVIGPGSEINQMGIVDTVPFDNLNLAGSNPLPSAPYDAGPASINNPTFGLPNFDVPGNKAYDLQEPGIDQIPEFAADPQVGDLLQFDRPHGTDILASSSIPVSQTGFPMAIDPMAPDLSLYDRPDNLLMPNPMSVDPTLPDLQQPTLTQQVHMPVRPGEMGNSDGTSPATSPDGDKDDDDGPMPDYDENNMQPGMSHRERHMNMLYSGLKGGL